MAAPGAARSPRYPHFRHFRFTCTLHREPPPSRALSPFFYPSLQSSRHVAHKLIGGGGGGEREDDPTIASPLLSRSVSHWFSDTRPVAKTTTKRKKNNRNENERGSNAVRTSEFRNSTRENISLSLSHTHARTRTRTRTHARTRTLFFLLSVSLSFLPRSLSLSSLHFWLSALVTSQHVNTCSSYIYVFCIHVRINVTELDAR